jgi:hypothetical protein
VEWKWSETAFGLKHGIRRRVDLARADEEPAGKLGLRALTGDDVDHRIDGKLVFRVS